MKKLVLLLIVVVCTLAEVVAQTFSKKFKFDGVGTICRTMELRDSFIFVACIFADTTNGGIKSALSKFDYNGNEISRFAFRPPEYLDYVATRENSMTSTSDGGLAATGYAIDSTGKVLLAFTKYDSMGALQFYKVIQPNVSNYQTVFGYRVLEYPGKGYYITGDMQLANYRVKAFLCLLDYSGNIVFFKIYQSSTYYDACKGLLKLNNGNLLLNSIGSDGNPNHWEAVGYSRLFEVDTLGTLKKLVETTDSNTYVNYNISYSADERFVSCGRYVADRIVNEYYQNQCAIIKWDTSYQALWHYSTGIPYLFNSYLDFEQTANNDIVICGTVVCDSTCNYGMVGLITKIDQNGNLIWNRHYKGYSSPSSPHNEFNYLYDIDLMPGGDIITIGYCQDQAIGQMGWLMRLNADGCMDDGWCGYTDISNTPANVTFEAVRVFPNPSSGVFTIQVDTDLPPASCITVFDVNGKQLLRQPCFRQGNLLNLHGVPSGMYYYEIGNGLVSIAKGKLVKE